MSMEWETVLPSRHPAIQDFFQMLPHIAEAPIHVLLLGETGTGKTFLAQQIHAHRPHPGPFVQVNCGALAPSLIEAALFGYEKGAFTGAEKAHKGFFEQANGGTLFLDEIGEFPLALQPRLLDVLERGFVRRLGGEHEISIDVRVIAATHRDLMEDIEDKRFREDLFYRLCEFVFTLPPLRERRNEIAILSSLLLEKMYPNDTPELTKEAAQALERCSWPGNIRQLRNTLKRAALFARDKRIELSHLTLPRSKRQAKQQAPVLPESIRTWWAMLSQETTSFRDLTQLAESMILEARLEHTSGNIKEAAHLLGISRGWMHRLLKKHNCETTPQSTETSETSPTYPQTPSYQLPSVSAPQTPHQPDWHVSDQDTQARCRRPSHLFYSGDGSAASIEAAKESLSSPE